MKYYIAKTVSGSFLDTVESVIEALKVEGVLKILCALDAIFE
jgi:hypothetical protein